MRVHRSIWSVRGAGKELDIPQVVALPILRSPEQGSSMPLQRVLSFKSIDTVMLKDSFPLGAESVNIRFILLQIWKQKKLSDSLMVGGFQER